VYFPHIIRLMNVKDRANDPAATASVAAAANYYEEMERLLSGGGWLARDYSYADIAFFMAALFGERHGVPITTGTPNLFAWRERMTQRAPVRTVVAAMSTWLKAAGRPVPQFMLAL
jgi:glutathione S-transferase